MINIDPVVVNEMAKADDDGASIALNLENITTSLHDFNRVTEQVKKRFDSVEAALTKGRNLVVLDVPTKGDQVGTDFDLRNNLYKIPFPDASAVSGDILMKLSASKLPYGKIFTAVPQVYSDNTKPSIKQSTYGTWSDYYNYSIVSTHSYYLRGRLDTLRYYPDVDGNPSNSLIQTYMYAHDITTAEWAHFLDDWAGFGFTAEKPEIELALKCHTTKSYASSSHWYVWGEN